MQDKLCLLCLSPYLQRAHQSGGVILFLSLIFSSGGVKVKQIGFNFPPVPSAFGSSIFGFGRRFRIEQGWFVRTFLVSSQFRQTAVSKQKAYVVFACFAATGTMSPLSVQCNRVYECVLSLVWRTFRSVHFPWVLWDVPPWTIMAGGAAVGCVCWQTISRGGTVGGGCYGGKLKIFPPWPDLTGFLRGRRTMGH